MASFADDGRFAYTQTLPDHPADIAVGLKGSPEARRITRLNDALFAFKELAQAEEVWAESSYDKRRIQAWIVKPYKIPSGSMIPKAIFDGS